MTKLEFLKKMYMDGCINGSFEGEDLKFESLDALFAEIKATIKRCKEIEDLEHEPEQCHCCDCENDCDCEKEEEKEHIPTEKEIIDSLKKKGYFFYSFPKRDHWFDEFDFFTFPKIRLH